MQHLKRKNIENKVNSKKNKVNKPDSSKVSLKNNKPIKQAAPLKVNKFNSSKVLPKDNKLTLQQNSNKPETYKAPIKNNNTKSSVNINKSIQNTPKINHSINQVSNNQPNINELKSNLDLIKNNILNDHGSITTGKLTANEIFVKNDNEFINIKDFINMLNNNKNNNLSNNENITANTINVLNNSIFNGKITIKSKNKEIELNPEKSSILCENGFIKNVNKNNDNSVINLKYLKL